MSRKDIIIGIVGSGGDGIITSGEMLVSSVAAEGIYAFLLKSFGPQIRGGESSCRVRISQKPTLSQGDKLDALVMFHWKNYHQFEEELSMRDGVIIFYDEDEKIAPEEIPIEESLTRTVYQVPFAQIAKDTAGTSLAKNLVMLGVLAAYYNLPSDGIAKSIRTRFAKKGEEFVESNLKAFQAGREYAANHLGENPDRLDYTKGEPNLVMDGNEAVAYGAMWAGCNFFAGYPITPSSEIMVFLIEQMPKFDRTVLQVEDEISAINMLIGASYSGMKAMTATSGPGISLMNEAIGLAAMAELPCVLVNVQRGGPSTGAPTKMEQADLQQALYGAHGDAPVAVVAPTDIHDCFGMTVTAFNIAEKYQTPVIVLSDQFIGQRKECLKPFDLTQFTTEQRITPNPEDLKEAGMYKRFENSDNGVSPITHPGMKNGQYLACGLTHNESGSPTSRHLVHERLNQKRYRKFEYLREEYELIERYGPEDAEIGILTWGSARGAVQEAIEQANSQGLKISGMIPKLLHPLPVGVLQAYVRSLQHLLVVELSYGAQFYRYLRSELELPAQTVVYKRSGCMPFMVEEISQQIQQLQR